MLKKSVALLVLCFVFAGTAHAWNDFGHMLVASVAWQSLSPATRAKVAALLKKNPDYSKWIQGVPPAQRDEYAFLHAATWPDDIKHDDRYTDDDDKVHGPRAARNVGYPDILRHRYWHYVDYAFSPDGTAIEPPDPVNIETQVRAFRQTLRSPGASEQLKSYDLVWLIHFLGDAHQPLHSTSRFTADTPKGDKGGGDVKVCPVACETKQEPLHVFWDDALGEGTNRAAVRAVALHLEPADAASAAIEDEHQWLIESLALAKSTVYAAPVMNGNGPFVLTAAYRDEARRIARQRAALAGARLARLLETSL